MYIKSDVKNAGYEVQTFAIATGLALTPGYIANIAGHAFGLCGASGMFSFA